MYILPENLENIIENATEYYVNQAGADRSGLVAAMWKVVVDKEPKSEAGKQLSILYGHLPMGKATAMDRFFERWRPSEVLN